MKAVEKIHLISMGYRRLGGSPKWAKPVGFACCVFDLSKQEWLVYFSSWTPPHEPIVYKSKLKAHEEDVPPVPWLAHSEAWFHEAFAKGRQQGKPFLSVEECVTALLE